MSSKASKARELRCDMFIFVAAIPEETDRWKHAQDIADLFHHVTRESTGETYPVRADVFLPGLAWKRKENMQAGQVHAMLLVAGWSRRPANEAPGTVIDDFYEVAKQWVLDTFPEPGPHWQPHAMPADASTAQLILKTSEGVVHTKDGAADLVLPGAADRMGLGY